MPLSRSWQQQDEIAQENVYAPRLRAQSCLTLVTLLTAPARLLCPWDSPGKNIGVGCHFLLQKMAGLPNQGIEPASSESTALQADSLLAKPPGKPLT